MCKAWQIEKDDNVAVVLENVKAGQAVEFNGKTLTASSDIPQGHKIAVSAIARGKQILKYSVPIGLAKIDIHPGDHVHTHNLEDITSQLCSEYYDKYMAKGAK